MFFNSTIQSTFNQFKNGGSFVWLVGFEIMNSLFYVIDHTGWKVCILDDNWSFHSFKTFTYPVYMITVENSLYMTGDKNIWKLDKNLNILIEYNATGTSPLYRGLYFNSTNGFLYVAPAALTEIHVFYLNLTFNHSFSTSPYKPWSIEGYNNKLYIGTTNGTVLVVQNEGIVNQFNGCGGYSVELNSILFDECGYMATSCDSPLNKLYLHFANGTFTAKTMSTPEGPRYIGFDSKGHFIQISGQNITIYNNNKN